MKLKFNFFPTVSFKIFILLLAFFFFSFKVSFAQDSAGVRIVPAIVESDRHLDPGEKMDLAVEITNLSSLDQNFFISKRDIIGVREGGVPEFATPSSELTGYELSDWIQLSSDQLFIPANGKASLPYIINVPSEASPGSYFGSIIVSVEPPEMRSSGASIGYEVANIINIRVAGEVAESARIRQFSTSKYIYGSSNVDFSVRIENEGNTLIKPIGPLEISNMFGKRVAMLNFNESQAGVFPKTKFSKEGTRDFEINWSDESPGFGRYEALLSVVYGDSGSMRTISSTVTFWILPMNIITPAVTILVTLFLVIYIGVRVYVKRSMAMLTSGSTRRLVRSRQRGQFPTLLVIISMLAVSALFFIILLLLFA